MEKFLCVFNGGCQNLKKNRWLSYLNNKQTKQLFVNTLWANWRKKEKINF